MSEEKKLIDPIIPTELEKPKVSSGFIDQPGIDKRTGLLNPMELDVRTKSTEEKIYIILYHLNPEDDMDEMYRSVFSLCVGRTEAYLDIKDKLESGIDIDIHRSRIMTETKQTEWESGNRKYYMIPYEECISVYAFCTAVKEFYGDDGFDIEDYNDGEVPEDPNDHLASHPTYLTAEQLEYRKELEAAIGREKFNEQLREAAKNGAINI